MIRSRRTRGTCPRVVNPVRYLVTGSGTGRFGQVDDHISLETVFSEIQRLRNMMTTPLDPIDLCYLVQHLPTLEMFANARMVALATQELGIINCRMQAMLARQQRQMQA